MALYLLKAMVLIVLGTIALLIVFIAKYWAPDRAVTELKRWQLPNSEFIDIQGMQAHIALPGKCDTNLNKVSMVKAFNAEPKIISSRMKPPETIVLLHGTSASLHTWEGWIKALSEQYCVVSMDLPGFGLTGPYVDERTHYSYENYATFVIQVLNHLKLDRVTLAGNSLGGKVAWRTAALYPERISRLILVDAVGYSVTPKYVPIGFKLAKYPVMSPIINRILPRSVVEKSVLSVYADDSKVNDALVDRYYELTLRQGNRQALSRRLNEIDDDSDQAQIKQLDIPTLILWGAKDDLIPVENAMLFHRDIRNSQLKIFDNLGHIPHEEDPLATVEVVKQFLSSELENE
ncbi:alpha/beta fold hydrolase [Psychrobacter sp. AOP7-B1-25]|uniref:alpha/beta fold hydrolase n=1 Tax=Psychrobacter sp. AOP7-B1-25 TaxID=3457644 RepID=UPI00402BCE42